MDIRGSISGAMSSLDQSMQRAFANTTMAGRAHFASAEAEQAWHRMLQARGIEDAPEHRRPAQTS
jgi:hypothetical protein